MKRIIVLCISMMYLGKVCAQESTEIMPAAGTPAAPKVNVAWNRYYDSKGLAAICKKIAAAYPQLAQLDSIGHSYYGKPIWCLTISDFSKGDPGRKPAMYIQANIHGNEMQGAEYALYTAWYLTESFADVADIRQLLAEKTFYIVPTINPDGRDNLIHEPATDGSARNNMIPVDLDGDGKYNEDGFDDLDGNGSITYMRWKDPKGRYFKRKDNPDVIELIRPETDSLNVERYEVAPEGGIDNDGDGRTDEDGIGTEFGAAMNNQTVASYSLDDFDMNRNWSWTYDKADDHKTGKIGEPFSHSETRAVRDFFYRHQNICVAQSYHNFCGEIYTGTANRSLASNPKYRDSLDNTPADTMIYHQIGIMAEFILPDYKYRINTLGLPGREIDWMYGKRGVFAFLNELLSHRMLFGERTLDAYKGRDWSLMHDFARRLLWNDPKISWKEYDHPRLGKVEVGGLKKNFGRLTPGFIMEYEAHRNMALSLYQCYETPHLEIRDVSVRQLGNGRQEITAVIANTRLLPTHSGQDLRHNLTPPDQVSLIAAGKVVKAMQVTGDKVLPLKLLSGQTVEISNIPGNSEITLRWELKGTAKGSIRVNSPKGGKAIRDL